MQKKYSPTWDEHTKKTGTTHLQAMSPEPFCSQNQNYFPILSFAKLKKQQKKKKNHPNLLHISLLLSSSKSWRTSKTCFHFNPNTIFLCRELSTENHVASRKKITLTGFYVWQNQLKVDGKQLCILLSPFLEF